MAYHDWYQLQVQLMLHRMAGKLVGPHSLMVKFHDHL